MWLELLRQEALGALTIAGIGLGIIGTIMVVVLIGYLAYKGWRR